MIYVVVAAIVVGYVVIALLMLDDFDRMQGRGRHHARPFDYERDVRGEAR